MRKNKGTGFRAGPAFLCLVLAGLTLMQLHGCGAGGVPDESARGGGAAPPRLSVYASFYPMYDFAAKIGKDRAEVVNMVPAGMRPHDFEPAAADIAGLEKADLFVYNGAGMEHWVQDVLASVRNKDLVAAAASEGIALRKLPGKGKAYDPHLWLSPANAERQMENIKDAFVRADPGNRDYYEANFGEYSAKLHALDAEFKEALSGLENTDVVTAHRAFGYLCGAYGLNEVPIEGLSADSEPDPRTMAEIIEFARQRRVKVVFFEETASPRVAEVIAKDLGARTGVLSTLEALSDAQNAAGADYFSVMRQNLEALKAALE